MKDMIITTSDQVEGKRIIRTLGLVKGNTIRARHLGRDIVASLRGIVGGEITEYTKMLAEAREQAVQRMIEEAEKKGANAIIGMRFATSMVMAGAAEILAYGTAVVVEGYSQSADSINKGEARTPQNRSSRNVRAD
jgi:uncharacterized protein YbjQ (UPF0145 family)